MTSFATLIHWCYAFGGLGVAMSYWPQLSLYWREPAARRSIAVPSWAAWSFGALVTSCYAALVVHDLPFTFISSLNTVASVLVMVFGLSARRRPRPGHMDAGVPVTTL